MPQSIGKIFEKYICGVGTIMDCLIQRCIAGTFWIGQSCPTLLIKSFGSVEGRRVQAYQNDQFLCVKKTNTYASKNKP